MQNEQTPTPVPEDAAPAKKQGMNLPNKITLLRVILIPFFVAAVLFLPMVLHGKLDFVWRIISGVLFIGIALTDMLDGKIARKYGLVTDFGKFLDPLADKLMTFGAMLALCVRYALDGATVFTHIYVWATFIVILRELAVTSMRLVVSGNANIVIAASWAGKVKTCTQIVSVSIILLEPVVFCFAPISVIADYQILSYIGIAAMVYFTLYSGIQYFRAYWPYLNTNK